MEKYFVTGLVSLIVAGLLYIIFLSPVWAEEWEVKDLNDHIEQTNFIIGNHCSGTLVSKEHRLILTNYHCIAKYIYQATEEVVNEKGVVQSVRVQKFRDLPVSQKSYRGHQLVGVSSYQAEITGFDEDFDLGLVQILADSIPHSREAVMFKGDQVYRGETVYAIGNPRMLDASVTKGILSSVNRSISIGSQEYSYFQMDARIAGGSSGGSLYNVKGQLIGVPGAGSMDGAINLAIPFTSIRTFLSDNCWESLWNDEATDNGVCKTEEEVVEEEDK